METKKVRFTTYVPVELKKGIAELSKEMRIPQSRLFEEAVEDLIAKYDHSDTARGIDKGLEQAIAYKKGDDSQATSRTVEKKEK